MTFEPAKKMLYRALDEGYAVGYFESWNLESLQGVLDAAEQTLSPIIVGFNGDFLSHAERKTEERLELYKDLGQSAVESATVPCCLIFNECSNDDWIRQAVKAGFHIVMPADEAASYDEYIQRVTTLTKYAHRHGIAVEAELGALPDGTTGQISGIVNMTGPQIAKQFVLATDVDFLAVSVGNVHISIKEKYSLNLDRLDEIRRSVSIPLVLNGGSGISSESLRHAISRGVAKVNYGTFLKQRYLERIRKVLATDEINPHKLLGMGGEQDVMVAGRKAVCDAVLERIEDLGCCGKA